MFPPNFWTNLFFFIDFRLCFLHNFFIYPTIEYFLELVRLCFPQNFWTNQHFFIGFFYLKSRSNMPENKGLPIFSTPSSPPPPFSPTHQLKKIMGVIDQPRATSLVPFFYTHFFLLPPFFLFQLFWWFFLTPFLYTFFFISFFQPPLFFTPNFFCF